LSSIINKIKNLLGLGQGHERTKRAKKNIAASFVIKGLSIAIGLVLVPMTINYLDPMKYGIWITISSLIAWFGFFDIGLGHGLRNRFAEALANGKHELARVYVSTTYAILTLIIGVMLLLFYVINPHLNWSNIVNAGENDVLQSELSILALVVFTFFCLRFVLKLITTILTADQKPALSSLLDLLGKSISFALIFLLTKLTKGSLLYLGIAVSSAPFIVLVLCSLWFFNGKYKTYRPSIKFVDFSKARDLLNLGVKFFVVQIAAILLYQTNNVIIAQLFGPAEVTSYNVAFKYFTVLMMGFFILMSPFWSAYTEAWAKRDTEWIRKSMKILMGLWGLLFVAGVIMLLVSKWVYLAWVGESVTIPFTMSALVVAWVLLNAWNGIFSQFLNGIGKIKLQLYLGISGAVINIPLAIYLGKTLGISGVLLANVMLGIVGSWVYPLQYRKIITKKASGIWNK
jgi:O-antigen/teichoic acid export membrane protein